jgi:sugar diacid utilization regulator
VVRYDDQYRTDLVATCAHRHTVAYRLERVKELSGLDPMQTEDRERLGLGLKAYRIIAPGLPR